MTGDEELMAIRECIEGLKNWLVIIDNADDLDDSRSSYLGYVPRYHTLGREHTGAIIWTTRDSAILNKGYGPKEGIDVSLIQRSDSLLIYRKLRSRADPLSLEELLESATDDETILLDELGDLPLDISQAAAYLRETDSYIREYVNRLRHSESKAWKLLGKVSEHHDDRQDSAIQTWIVSFRHLEGDKKVGSNALKILKTTACFYNQGMTLELLQYSVVGDKTSDDDSIDDFRHALTRLVQYSFFQCQKDPSSKTRLYSQHKLVSMAMRHYLNENGGRPEHAARAFKSVLYVFPKFTSDEKHNQGDNCRIYLPHALKVLDETSCSDFQNLADDLLDRLSCGYECHGCYEEAKVMLEKLIGLREKSKKPGSHEGKLEAQSTLGWIYVLKKKYKEAEELLISTLAGQKEVLGDNHFWVLEATGSLAIVATRLGQYDKAEALQLTLLEHCKQERGTSSELTLNSINELAITYNAQGRLDEAKKMYTDILRTLIETNQKLPYLTSSVQYGLARVYRDQGALDKAESLLKSAVKVDKTLRGDSHPSIINSMYSLFIVYVKQGRLKDAQELGSEVLELKRATCGDKHSEFVTTNENLQKLREIEEQHRDDDDPASSIKTSLIAYGKRNWPTRKERAGQLEDEHGRLPAGWEYLEDDSKRLSYRNLSTRKIQKDRPSAEGSHNHGD